MSGLILIDKPSGITSFGVVARIKRIAGEKRVGHTGTLDPMATGVLPVLVGTATSLSSYLLDGDKSYTAKIKLGITTDSLDITGNVLSENAVSLENLQLQTVLESFLGKQLQTPPMYSAIKKDGVRLYELARKGIELEIPARQITVHSIKLLSPLDENNEFSIDVRVSKGTYIRSLCRDIGEALGCGAVLTSLCRTDASGFSIKSCVKLEQLTEENFKQYLSSEEKAVEHFDALCVTEPQARRFTNGGQLSYERLKSSSFSDNQILRIKCGERFLGLGFADNERSQIGIKCIVNKYE